MKFYARICCFDAFKRGPRGYKHSRNYPTRGQVTLNGKAGTVSIEFKDPQSSF
jgi:hypothetical protein